MEEMEVYAIKLNSGEELIARVVVKSEDEWELHNARSLVMGGGGQLSLAPVVFSASKDSILLINRSSIVVYTKDLREEFKHSYLQTVSNLTLPTAPKPSSIIMG